MSSESAQPSLLRNASQQLASTLINLPNQNQGPGQGYTPPEGNQPTLRRTSTTTQTDRERFNEQQQQLAMQMCIQAVPFLCCVWWLFVTFIGVTFWVYISGVSIYVHNKNKPCDKPLANWVWVMLLIPPIRMVICHIRACVSTEIAGRIGVAMHIFSILGYPFLLVLGAYWLLTSESCEKTNPELYTFVRIFLLYHVFQWAVVLLVVCGLFRVIFFLHSHGLLGSDSQRPARDGLVNELDQITFDPALFSEKPEDDKPSPECCICQTAYQLSDAPEDLIVRTKCQHYFHKECLGGWLQKARTCPLCRFDLETGQQEENSAAEP